MRIVSIVYSRNVTSMTDKKIIDITKKPDDDESLIDQMMQERRRQDALRSPNMTDITQVRNDLYSILRWRREKPQSDMTLENREIAAEKHFTDLHKRFPKLLKMAVTCTDENRFLMDMSFMLKNIESVQKGKSTIQNCTDTVEMYLGKTYCVAKKD